MNKLQEILKIAETLNSRDLENLTTILQNIKTGRTLKQHKIKTMWVEARQDIHPVCKV